MSSSVHVASKKNNLVFGEGPTQGLDGKTLTVENKYSINFTEKKKKIMFNIAL